METDPGRWKDIERLLVREGRLVGPGFEPCPELLDFFQNSMRILVIGAGGLGCELLKDLALCGVKNIDVIDMDTIDVSNLNRQFLFRPRDVGKPKAVIAAERVMERVAGVTVTPHYGRIEMKDPEWYKEFHVIVLGLDSVEARSYINGVVCGFLEYNEDDTPNTETIKPMVDGGTEGFKGHSRVIVPGVTPCFHCNIDLFPPQTKFPLCTLAETPRNAAHCIEYAHLIQWGQERAGESFDPDNPDHMKWVFEQALVRAERFNISGVTFSHTQGVVKNIIPAIPSTNAIVAASCALEAVKIATCCSTGMNNYMMYTGTRGTYTYTMQLERNPQCVVCSPGVSLRMPADCTLQAVVDRLQRDFRDRLPAPSVSYGSTPLFMRGVLEGATRGNLEKRMEELLEGKKDGALLIVNDKKLLGPMRVRLWLGGDEDMQ